MLGGGHAARVARATRSVKARGVSVSARAAPAATTMAANSTGSNLTIRTLA
jgi:hypothetical protein